MAFINLIIQQSETVVPRALASLLGQFGIGYFFLSSSFMGCDTPDLLESLFA